jgi:hypothetical protein
MAASTFMALLLTRDSSAWLFPEHVQLGYAGAEGLDAREREVFHAAWDLVRGSGGLTERLCENPVQPEPLMGRGASSWCIGLATLPALAADHSCSPAELDRAIRSDWLVDVLTEAQRLGAQLASTTEVLERLDARRRHDIELQLLDARYLTRATASGAHFQLPRTQDEPADAMPSRLALTTYLHRALATGQATNATALYVNYHAEAIARALDARKACPDGLEGCQAGRAAVWAALLAESFALHFLEDAFSAGHFVASWGNTSERFGTHDHYCRHGIEAQLFKGGSYVAHGDLFLTDEDKRRAAHAVTISLRHVLHALTPGSEHEREIASFARELTRATPARDFNACTSDKIPPGLDALEHASLTASIASWPKPGLRTPEAPRFRAEYGWFFGASLGQDVGFSANSAQTLVDLRLRAALRVGFGLDAVMSRYMDGAIFADVLYGGMWQPRLGRARSGLGGRLHLPFAVLPGDGLLAPFAQLGWKPGIWVAKHAALGTIWGNIERLGMLGEAQTIQLCIGRDLSFLYYPSEDSAQDTERWEFFLPVINLRMGRAHGGQVANELNMDLAMQMVSPVGPEPNAYGGVLTFSVGSRLYP